MLRGAASCQDAATARALTLAAESGTSTGCILCARAGRDSRPRGRATAGRAAR